MLQGLYAGVVRNGAIVFEQLLIQTAVTGLFKFLDGFFVDYLQGLGLYVVDELLTVLCGVLGLQNMLCLVSGVDCVLDQLKYTVQIVET